MAEHWSIVPEAYAGWANRWADRFSPDMDPLTPSVRNIVFLALLDKQGEESSYEDLQAAIAKNAAVNGEIPKDNLRVAVLELRGKLSDTQFRLQSDRRGREAVLRLAHREDSSHPRSLAGDGGDARQPFQVLRQLESSSATPAQLAWALVRDRGLDHKQLYVLPRSASSWTTYSESETFSRRDFEREAFGNFFGDWLKKPKGKKRGICLLGLNVGGEGEAELVILRDLLELRDSLGDFEFERVHYLAVDLSGQLLADHSVYLNHHFGAEIKAGRLVCAVKAASFDDELKASIAVAEVRAEFLHRYPEVGEFFSEDYPLLCSYLSNYIGNKSRPGCEWDTFNTVFSVFPRHPDHAFFVGFASIIPDPNDPTKALEEKYKKEWFDFLLQTPRELLYNIKVLSSDLGDAELPEFTIPNCTQDKFEKAPYAQIFLTKYSDYIGAGDIRGMVYKFSYITRGRLSMKYEGRDYELKNGTNLDLYNIVKFDPETLKRYLERMGLNVVLNKGNGKSIGEGEFEHRYQLLSAFEWSNRPPTTKD
jgi:hypothetical protein